MTATWDMELAQGRETYHCRVQMDALWEEIDS